MRVFTLREKLSEIVTLLTYIEGINAIAEAKSIGCGSFATTPAH